ncbi:acyltransferase family protein [Weissella koreensis]|uniref:acyltransferase family protein n=1 Tax=Weissella koreensis TaxID=165096 RepID=UPI000CF2FF2F|nr:acyltransferase family protein [Weissella koreensis]AVH75877.1 hypothetical protein C4597_07550 [Weissella koreensis]
MSNNDYLSLSIEIFILYILKKFQNLRRKIMRIKYLDIARGLAMIMVIIGHIIQPEIMGNTLRYYLFAVHLPLFLIISGILFKEKDYKVIFKKNIQRLLIPYLIGVLLIIVIFIVGSHQDVYLFWHEIVLGNLNSVTYILKSAILVNGGDYYAFLPKFNTTIGAIWYLIGYFEASLLFNTIIKLVSSKWGQISLIIIFTIIGYGIGIYTALPFQILSAFVMLPFLGAGYYTKKYWLNSNIQTMKIDIFISIIGLIFWYFSGKNGILLLVSAQATQGPILGILGGIMGSFAIMTFIRFFVSKGLINKFIPILVNFGQLSVMMMVVHTLDLRVFPVSFASMRIMHHFIDNEILIVYLAMIIAIVFAYIGALIINFIGKKIQTIYITSLSRV